MFLVTDDQVTVLETYTFSIVVERMKQSLYDNLSVMIEKPVEMARLESEMKHAINNYNIVREDLLEEYLHMLYEYPSEIRGCTPQSEIGQLLYCSTKSEVLKIEELHGLVITYAI